MNMKIVFPRSRKNAQNKKIMIKTIPSAGDLDNWFPFRAGKVAQGIKMLNLTSEFGLWDWHGRRREPTQASCAMLYTSALSPHITKYMYVIKIKIIPLSRKHFFLTRNIFTPFLRTSFNW